jgi:putative pyruvate formate lyase activating enzyme
VDRQAGKPGFCGITDELRYSQAVIHTGEEPPLSGQLPHGSGAIFFSQCNLSCVFCQNYSISQDPRAGEVIDAEKLVDLMFLLKSRGALNINLVSPTPYAVVIAKALFLAKQRNLGLPIIYNTGGYDSLECLSLLDGLVDIYLPDAKLAAAKDAEEGDPDSRSMRLLGVGDYPWVNRKAILEMYRQVGNFQKDDKDIAYKGLLIRHLVLPDNLARTKELLPWIRENFGTEVAFTLMSQYYPTNKVKIGYNPLFRDMPGLGRPLSLVEYSDYVEQAISLQLENTFIQEPEAAFNYLPDFSKPDAFN